MRNVAILAIGLTGCVYVQLSPEAESVRVTSNGDAVHSCRLLGDVQGSDQLNGGLAGQMAAEENAQRALKNNAAKMGANMVLVVSGATGPSGSRQRGEAYICPTAPDSTRH